VAITAKALWCGCCRHVRFSDSYRNSGQFKRCRHARNSRPKVCCSASPSPPLSGRPTNCPTGALRRDDTLADGERVRAPRAHGQRRAPAEHEHLRTPPGKAGEPAGLTSWKARRCSAMTFAPTGPLSGAGPLLKDGRRATAEVSLDETLRGRAGSVSCDGKEPQACRHEAPEAPTSVTHTTNRGVL
jgi:hypothetical protein